MNKEIFSTFSEPAFSVSFHCNYVSFIKPRSYLQTDENSVNPLLDQVQYKFFFLLGVFSEPPNQLKSVLAKLTETLPKIAQD